MKLRWVMCLSSLWPLLLCPYDITQQGGNHGKLQSQSCYSESAYCSQIICILGTHASTQRVYLISRPGFFLALQRRNPFKQLCSLKIPFLGVFSLFSRLFFLSCSLPVFLWATSPHSLKQGPQGTPSFHSCFSLSGHVCILWGRVNHWITAL